MVVTTHPGNSYGSCCYNLSHTKRYCITLNNMPPPQKKSSVFKEEMSKTNTQFCAQDFLKFKIPFYIVCRQPSNETPHQISFNSDQWFQRRRLSKIFSVVAMATRPMMQSKFRSVSFVSPNLLIIMIKFREILSYSLEGEVV